MVFRCGILVHRLLGSRILVVFLVYILFMHSIAQQWTCADQGNFPGGGVRLSRSAHGWVHSNNACLGFIKENSLSMAYFKIYPQNFCMLSIFFINWQTIITWFELKIFIFHFSVFMFRMVNMGNFNVSSFVSQILSYKQDN